MKFIDDRICQVAAQMVFALPVKCVVNHDAFRRSDNSVLRREEISAECFGIRVDQPGLRLESKTFFRKKGTVGLKVIKLSGLNPFHEYCPDVSPTICRRIKRYRFDRVRIFRIVIKEKFHRCRHSADNGKLNPSFAQYRAEGKLIGETE